MAEFQRQGNYNFVPFSENILFRYEDATDLPGHDTVDPERKTGEIEVTFTARTPVFISDGGAAPDGPHFVRGTDGTYQIPASTLKGLVRENLQILGFGAVRPGADLEDASLYAWTLDRAHASGALYGEPHAERAGYLCRENGAFCIRPAWGHTAWGRGTFQQNYQPIPRRQVPAFAPSYGTYHAVTYHYHRGRVGAITPLAEGADAPELADGLYPGTLLCPEGANTPLYLFPQEEPGAEAIPVTGEDLRHWTGPLPQEGERLPVFYFRHKGRTYVDRWFFLHIDDQHPARLSQGLPTVHREAREDGKHPVDYPGALLGFFTYRSRVSFGPLRAEGAPEELDVTLPLPYPKPACAANYVEDGRVYDREGFRLRGYKQFWLRETAVLPPEDGQPRYPFRPLPAGTAFSGVIRYEDLTEDELGLLLWALRLDDGCYQSVGMGRFCGFGRMESTITALRELDMAGLYRDFAVTAPSEEDTTERVAAYIARYDAWAAPRLKQSTVRDCPEVRDFLFIHRLHETLPDDNQRTLPTIRAYRERMDHSNKERAR